ncbi:MAG: PAS domain S-box protein [Microcoleaceae cyanobacterium]
MKDYIAFAETPNLSNLNSAIVDIFQSPVQLEKLINNVPGVIYQFRLEPDGKRSFPYISQGVKEVYGFEPEQVQQNPELLFSVVHPEDDYPLEQKVIESAQTLQRWQYEWRIILPCGQQKWLKGTSQPEKQSDGVIMWSGYITDITERKQAESALVESEAQFRRLVENANDLIWSSDLDSTLTYISPVFEQMFGYPVGEWLGQSFCPLVHSDDLPNLMKFINQVIETGKNVTGIEFRYLRKSGEWHWVMSNVWPVKDNHGNVIGLQGILRDITERKQAEARLQQQQSQIKSILDNIPHIAWLKDEDSRFIAVNEPFAEACGVVCEEIIGQTDYHLWPVELAEAYRQDDFNIMQSCQRQQIEEKMVDSTGNTHWIETYKTPIFDENKQVMGTAGIAQDITERKNLEIKLTKQTKTLKKALKQLKQTQAKVIQTEKMSSLGKMVGGIAHEINNPVNFISANIVHAEDYIQDLFNLIYLYQEYYPDPTEEIQDLIEEIDLDYLKDDFQQLIESMKVGSQRIQNIVLSLRNFSRLDEAELKEVDLHQGIENTLLILNNRLQKGENSQIEIIKEYNSLPRVYCYPGKLNQVFLNLLENAIDALRASTGSLKAKKTEDKQIRIQTSLINSDWVAIYIRDNGVGIPDKIKDKIFDPFFTTKPVGQGTGIGLSNSYHIITELHKGQIEYDSTVEEGTEFIIKIPITSSPCYEL